MEIKATLVYVLIPDVSGELNCDLVQSNAKTRNWQCYKFNPKSDPYVDLLITFEKFLLHFTGTR